MKETIYTCDNEDCGKSANSNAGWLTIGGVEDNTLVIENRLPNARFTTMSHFQEIHLCSEDCVGRFLINKPF